MNVLSAKHQVYTQIHLFHFFTDGFMQFPKKIYKRTHIHCWSSYNCLQFSCLRINVLYSMLPRNNTRQICVRVLIIMMMMVGKIPRVLCILRCIHNHFTHTRNNNNDNDIVKYMCIMPTKRQPLQPVESLTMTHRIFAALAM